MKKIAAFSTLCALSALASAQSGNFGGFSLGLNADLVAASTEVSGTRYGQQSVGASLQGAYGFAVSNTAVLSVGFTYGLADINAGESGTAKYKLKNAYSIYFEPGFNVSPATLAYFKLSYEAASANYEATGTSDSKSIEGAGLGVGLRAMLSKNAYLQAEARQMQYNSARFAVPGVDFKSAATYGTIGVGYKF